MFRKQECVAMLLAGGQGSRLYALTRQIAKPAVPYGGKYRIIDFPLSNCINSGIETVGVLTQYRPLVLNEYIGSGEPWDLDRMDAGVHVLPPYQAISGAGWYKGTANAIYQNIEFIERYDPEYVLVLSGDHIYKMDYAKMIAQHKERGADCTIAVLEVEMEEAKRFGIMNADETGLVYEFEEKPANPKSNLASMGIYVFSWDKLRRYLIEDEADENSANDFGKNIIPNMLANGEKLYTYRFDGYWKDVGTIDSLWEANMDLLDPKVPLNMRDTKWRVYSRTSGLPPHYIGENAKVQNSMISEGSEIEGNMEFSIAFPGVVVEEGAEIVDAILMPGAHVGKNAKVQYAILAEDVVVEEGAVVGEKPEEMKDLDDWGVAVVASGVRIGAGVKVPAKAMIEEDQKGGEQA